MITRLIEIIRKIKATRSSRNYINYLRKKGVLIGDNVVFRSPRNTRIDITRPSLIEIGNKVDINQNFQILTHDWASCVFRNYYHELLPSSGKVKLGNNIYIGTNVIILKGVTIGDNCVIGAGSVVNKSIPANSVAVGVPCKVICSLDEYFEKRKSACIEEALEYARSIKNRFNRMPVISDFWEEFPLFMEGEDNLLDKQLIISQLGGVENYEAWKTKHKSTYESFEGFLKAAGITE